jgi:Tfp pilus assembly protein PilX
MNRNIRQVTTRRGSLYIAVLGVALLITIIGISAMLAARVEHRALVDTEAAVKADFGATSITDLALFWITADYNWRTTYTNNTWTPALATDGMTLRFKLVDELDGNLANDPTQPVRLYAKAIVGRAVRLESVLLQPTPSPNLLSNADMENGTTGWLSWNCSLTAKTTLPHAGAQCLLISSRGSIDAEAYQLVTSSVQNGTTYYVEIWAKTKAGTEQVTISLKIVTGASTKPFTTTPTTVGTTWTKVSGTLTPTWTGTLTEARCRTFTYPSGGTSDYYIDDAILVEQGTKPVLTPIPGTWRQEIRTGTPAIIPDGGAVPQPS